MTFEPAGRRPDEAPRLEDDDARPFGALTSIPWHQAIGIPLNVLCFLLLMVIAWGDARGFFSHPARTGMVALHLLMIPVMTLCTAGRSRGERNVPDWKPFFPLLVLHSLVTACAMPYMDARGIAVLPGGDALRWSGLALLVAGAGLRLASMVTLGRRFASVVSLQSRHELHTSGLYRSIRHPSYLGILVMDVGFAALFRSALGLGLLPLVFWMFKRRMDVEERFLAECFGAGYRDYVSRTRRLLPGGY
jgi:protein-S-isoprenylcysteine O-methyltransferase Ste14